MGQQIGQIKHSVPTRQGVVAHTNGAVTIYFIAITAALVLLTALLIDFARVAAFRKQAELAVKSGARSVLSSFDPVLYGRYGLFIRGGEASDELFREIVLGNSVPAEEQMFPYLNARWETTDLMESRPIATHEVFRRQILEEMKYKAPIDLTLEMAQRMRGVSAMLKETADTVAIVEQMRKAYDRRETALDQALEYQSSYGEKVQKQLKDLIPDSAQNLNAELTDGKIETIADLVKGYDDYVSKRTEDEARREAIRLKELEREKRKQDKRKGLDFDGIVDEKEEELAQPQYEAIVARFESGATKLATSLASVASKTTSLAEQAYNKTQGAWRDAQEANEEMRAIAEQARTLTSTEVNTEDTSKEQQESLAELRQSIEDLLLDSQYFDQYEAEIVLQHQRGADLANELNMMSALVASVPKSTGKGAKMKSEAERLSKDFDIYTKAYGPSGSVISERSASFEEYRSKDEERKQEEEKAKSEWKGALRLLSALTESKGTEEERAQFKQLDHFTQQNLEWNKTHAVQLKVEQSKDPSAGRDEAMSASNVMLDILQDALINSRDELYFTEYTMSRLSHYDPPFVKQLISGGDAPLSYEYQEAEYVLYGFNHPAGNIAAAYGEIFAFRLAIRTMEGFVECRTMGHPLLVLAGALVYGITNAMKDLTTLIEKGKVELSKYVRIDTTYTDYLRLFLLLHGGGTGQMARMIAVMEIETGVSFDGAYTYVSGEATASIKLWFFPGLLKIFGGEGDLGGTIKGNRYEATYIADSSY
ncbi:MAG: hypothetical protein P0Y55_03110 [Candidatus Cohnella colombiensis]|uniref:Uncharacterized protein n=1 Tax=Candidatus Cohnella colombiensis TaxID=3121368 RepID=A0AA95JCD9_9BACL|nr:MAG: hypothetical protein P0Y55_03110 [Cohnella sp.]